MIVFIVDYDIIKGSTIDFFDYGARRMCEVITAWLVNNCHKAVQGMREAMKKLKPGSVLTGEPKMIYTKMIYKPCRDGVQAIRNNFNVALENVLCHTHNHYVLDISVPATSFDATNFLTAQGELQFWRSFYRQIQDFDEKESQIC